MLHGTRMIIIRGGRSNYFWPWGLLMKRAFHRHNHIQEASKVAAEGEDGGQIFGEV